MTQTEVRVRHMQLQILREMKQLETQVEEYYMEMKKVANGIIGTTDVPNFELHFGSRPRRTSSKSTQDNIVAFRDQIVKGSMHSNSNNFSGLKLSYLFLSYLFYDKCVV